MSAIFGAISLNGDSIDEKLGEKFQENYAACKIDRHELIKRPDAVMGCEIQYFNQEAKLEKLPLIDEERHLMFTADCVLDNRETLRTVLEIESDSIPDGAILYQAYLKWGKQCMEHLRGVFSFVVYNWETKEVYLQTDHFSNRCLFYQLGNGILYFSTLFFPLVKSSMLRYDLNERWFLDSLSLRSPVMITEPKETAVCGVYKIVSGTYVEVINQQIHEVEYWNPGEKVTVNPHITDQECERQLLQIMIESVRQAIRTDGEVAVQLSAGLDSSTVACLASPVLESQGKCLHAYTSVPLSEANLPKTGYLLYDETEGVMKICQEFPNIHPTFLDCRGKNIFTEAKDLIREWEMPCKSEQNAVWVREIHKKAAEENCKILLSGSTGNCTISAGNMGSLLDEYIHKGRWIKAYQTASHYVEKYHGRKKAFLKSYLMQHLAYYTWYFDQGRKDPYQSNITRKVQGEQYQQRKRLQKILHCRPFPNRKKMKTECYMVNANAQIGELNTANSLYHGILERDPMRNVEFIEFCMSLPLRCFVNHEYDRRLIREFMHDIVPEDIRLDVAHRGRQSGDNEYRICKVWDMYLPEVKKVLFQERLKKYIDQDRAEQYFSKLEEKDFQRDFMEMRMLVDSYMHGLFLRELDAYLK